MSRRRRPRPSTARAVARLSAAAALFVVACAQPGIPPGGPVDKDPPQVVAVSPETGSVNVRPRSVLLRFDEVVNERSTPIATTGGRSGTIGGGSGGSFSGGSQYGSNQMGSSLGSLVILSPGDGRERVSWRRTGIEIEPRGGFRANTTYRLTLLPGLGDLRGNVLKEPIEVVFSTGATRTEGTVRGVLFDWVAGTHLPGGRIELFARADTTLRWRTTADSLGFFSVRDLAPGTYLLRGWNDGDNDRRVGLRESFDSLTVTVDSAITTELYAFVHDTLGPRMESLEAIDSTALRVKFDRGVATDWRPDERTAVVLRADSSVVALARMVPAAVFDSARKVVSDRADSVAQAADTSAQAADTSAAADTAAARDTTGRAAPPARAPGRAPPRIETVREGVDIRTGIDTVVRIPPPKMTRAAPILTWVIEFAAPLPPGSYTLKLNGVKSLTGYARPSEREFRLRPPPPPGDTAAPAGRTAPTSPATRPSPAAPATRPSPAAPTRPVRPPA